MLRLSTSKDNTVRHDHVFTYRVYNFIIASEIEFPELMPAKGAAEAWIRRSLLSRQDVISFHDGGDRIGSGVDGLIHFQVEGGREIRVHLFDNVDVSEARSVILGGILATLLRQRGMLVLHACAVARDDHAYVFVGDSGWGKSTLAEFFCQNGYQLINDDVVALDVSSENIIVVPGYPQIKLRQEAGRFLRKDFVSLAPISRSGDKRGSVWATAFQDSPVQLRRMYFLQPYAASKTAVEAIPAQESIRQLIQHTRVNHLITSPDYCARHLQQCAEVLERTPVAWLHRKKALEALPEIQAIVEQDEMLA